MENLEEQANLVRHASMRFRTAKIAKALSALLIATATAVGSVSCATTDINPPQIVDGTGSSSSHGQGSTNESKYSELLEGVINNAEYQTLIKNAKANPELFESAQFDPHPYGFFEDEGYDISAIKDGTMKCETTSYVLDEEPNNLYIATRLLVNDDYYATYILKYELTKKEMSDYKMLHGTQGREFTFSYQSAFINDAISRTKEVTIVGESKIKTNVIEMADERYKSKFEGACSILSNIYMLDLNSEEKACRVVVIPESISTHIAHDGGYVLEKEIRTLSKISHENGIFNNSPLVNIHMDISSIKHDASFFHIQNLYWEYSKDATVD